MCGRDCTPGLYRNARRGSFILRFQLIQQKKTILFNIMAVFGRILNAKPCDVFVLRPCRGASSISYHSYFQNGHNCALNCGDDHKIKRYINTSKTTHIKSHCPVFTQSIHTSAVRLEKKAKKGKVYIVDLTEKNLSSEKPSDVDVKEWDPKSKAYDVIYRTDIRLLKAFTILGLISRIAVQMTLLSVPVSLICAQTEIMTFDEAINLNKAMCLSAFPFVSTSVIYSKFVAEIKLSEDNKYVLLSHQTIFGRKRTIVATPSDCVPIKGDFKGNFGLRSSKIMQIKKERFSERLMFFPGLTDKYSPPDLEAIEKLFSTKQKS